MGLVHPSEPLRKNVLCLRLGGHWFSLAFPLADSLVSISLLGCQSMNQAQICLVLSIMARDERSGLQE